MNRPYKIEILARLSNSFTRNSILATILKDKISIYNLIKFCSISPNVFKLKPMGDLSLCALDYDVSSK